MKKIQIEITDAKLCSFRVSYKIGKFLPEIGATIDLTTANGKQIASFSIDTDSWNDDNKFKAPPEIYDLIAQIESILESEATRHCMASLKTLPAPKEVYLFPSKLKNIRLKKEKKGE